jgi:hypothetical protein
MKRWLMIAHFTLLMVWNLWASPCADLIIFSCNRPLQLYALLESLGKYCRGIHEAHVIYRTSSEQFEHGYDIVKHDFSHVYYYQQGSNPHKDFKPLVLAAVFGSPSPYVIFAVDDIIVKKEIDLTACIDALEKYNAYGFYLRLGLHLNNCYSYGSKAQPLPPLKEEEPGIFSWNFPFGLFDWNYPHTVDMTLYRKKDIEHDLHSCSYHAPNRLEEVWQRRAGAIINKKGLCYVIAPIVNLPLNRVQHEYQNRAMKEWSPHDLLQQFLAGYKMDIMPLYDIQNSAAHMEYSPTFILREGIA